MLYGRATKSFSGDDETDAVVLVAVAAAAAAGVGSFVILRRADAFLLRAPLRRS